VKPRSCQVLPDMVMVPAVTLAGMTSLLLSS
jgi:hypothetical protein